MEADTDSQILDKQKRKQRAYDCAAWGILLTLGLSVSLIITNAVARLERGWHAYYSLQDAHNLVFYLFYACLIPIVIGAAIVGASTKPPASFRRSAAIIVPAVTVSCTLFLDYLLTNIVGFPNGLIGQTFWNPVAIGITAFTCGLVIGLIASYGYWWAGRKITISRQLYLLRWYVIGTVIGYGPAMVSIFPPMWVLVLFVVIVQWKVLKRNLDQRYKGEENAPAAMMISVIFLVQAVVEIVHYAHEFGKAIQ